METTILNRISPYFANPLKKKEETRKTFSPALKQLEKDTVSFSAGSTLKKISTIAQRIHTVGNQKASSFERLCSKIFDKKWTFETRIKKPDSMQQKYINKVGAEEKTLYSKFINIITDQAGARVVTDGSQKATDDIVENLVKEVNNGNITLSSIRNYHGRGTEPYFSKENLTLLKNNSNSGSLKILDGKDAEKANGYTAAHLTGKTKNGLNFEIQIKGPEVAKVDRSTHITHDLSIDKKLKEIINSSAKRKLLAPIIKEFKSLSTKQTQEYNNYLRKYYKTARANETSKTKFSFPQLPKGISELLSIENLGEIAQQFKLI